MERYADKAPIAVVKINHIMASQMEVDVQGKLAREIAALGSQRMRDIDNPASAFEKLCEKIGHWERMAGDSPRAWFVYYSAEVAQDVRREQALKPTYTFATKFQALAVYHRIYSDVVNECKARFPDYTLIDIAVKIANGDLVFDRYVAPYDKLISAADVATAHCSPAQFNEPQDFWAVHIDGKRTNLFIYGNTCMALHLLQEECQYITRWMEEERSSGRPEVTRTVRLFASLYNPSNKIAFLSRLHVVVPETPSDWDGLSPVDGDEIATVDAMTIEALSDKIVAWIVQNPDADLTYAAHQRVWAIQTDRDREMTNGDTSIVPATPLGLIYLQEMGGYIDAYVKEYMDVKFPTIQAAARKNKNQKDELPDLTVKMMVLGMINDAPTVYSKIAKDAKVVVLSVLD